MRIALRRPIVMRCVSVAAALLMACATTPLPPPAPAVAARSSTRVLADVDWQAQADETLRDLSGYLAVPTVNPPGDEKPGAQYLAALLAKDGIDSEIDVFDPQQPSRANLYARLKGDGTGGGPLCLTSHIDVVTVETQRWPKDTPPFAGVTTGDGDARVLWGRGALDMKVLGVFEVELMRMLKRNNVKLTRDIVLIAVADEELGGQGMRHVVNDRWSDFQCTHAINEGGLGLKDALFPGQTAFAISVGERGVLWLKMKASGPPGHGSTPVPGRAPERLLLALDRIRARVDHPRLHPALYALLAAAGRDEGGLSGFVMQRPMLVDHLVVGKLLAKPQTRAIITDTVNITGFYGANAPNVVPAEVGAQLDCRVLPGTAPHALLAELKELTADVEGISFEVLDARPANFSTWDDPLYRALATYAPTLADPGARSIVGPVISPGFTDSIHLRDKGVIAYGFVPIVLSGEEALTMHGDGERISRQNLLRGLRALSYAVTDVSAH